MYLVINKCVTAVIVSNFSGHYLRNRSTLDIGVLGYIGIVQHKEHSPEVLSIPPGTPCIQTYRLNRSVPSLRDKQSQEVVSNRRKISISLPLPTGYSTWPTCFSVCSQRQFCVIYCDVSNSSALVPHTLLTSAPAQQPIHYPVCLVVEAIGRRPTPWTERPPQSACTPFTQAQCDEQII